MSISRRASSVAATMLCAWIALSPVSRAAGAMDSDQVNKFLSDAKMQGFLLMEGAAELQIFPFIDAGDESRADDIRRIKTDLDQMGRVLEQLQENRASASPWQQGAIDRIAPPARELSATLTKALKLVESHRGHLTGSSYRDYLAAVAETARSLSSTITDFVDYGKAKERLDALAQQLDPEAGS